MGVAIVMPVCADMDMERVPPDPIPDPGPPAFMDMPPNPPTLTLPSADPELSPEFEFEFVDPPLVFGRVEDFARWKFMLLLFPLILSCIPSFCDVACAVKLKKVELE